VAVPGQPALGIHAKAVAPPATSPTARRLYAALDAAYAARARFLRDGKGCLGIRTIDCFFKLNSLGARVATAGGVVGEIARTSTEQTPCGVATRGFANGEQLLRATVSTWIAASDPEDNDPPSEVREAAEHAIATYNLALLGFRAAWGEHPSRRTPESAHNCARLGNLVRMVSLRRGRRMRSGGSAWFGGPPRAAARWSSLRCSAAPSSARALRSPARRSARRS